MPHYILTRTRVITESARIYAPSYEAARSVACGQGETSTGRPINPLWEETEQDVTVVNVVEDTDDRARRAGL